MEFNTWQTSHRRERLCVHHDGCLCYKKGIKMLNKSKSIGLSLFVTCQFVMAAARGQNYEIRPKCDGAQCRPSQGFGFVDTNWRSWPGQPRPEIDFPSSIGHKILPPPPGKIEKPLPDASVVPTKPEIKSDDTGSPAAPTQGGRQVLPGGSGFGPSTPGATVPGATVPGILPAPGAGGSGTAPAGGLGTGGMVLPDSSLKPPMLGRRSRSKVDQGPRRNPIAACPAGGPAFEKLPGGDALPNPAIPNKSPAPMPEKTPLPIPDNDAPPPPAVRQPATPGIFPGETPKTDSPASPKPSDRGANDAAPMGPMLEPPTSHAVAVNQPMNVNQPTIQADWNTALTSESVNINTTLKASFAESVSKTTVDPKLCAIGGYSPVQLCDGQRWVVGDANINCD